jgi:hypothetical protein
MKLPKTKTTLLLKTAIRDLSTPDKPLDPEDIIWLHTLADRVYHPTTFNRHLAFTRAPIVLPSLSVSSVSSVVLYPITFQAVTWLIAVLEWWTHGDLLPAAFACAHSHGNAVATFLQTDRNAVEQTIKTWSDSLPCTPDDLREAVRIQTNVPELQITVSPEPPNTDATEWGELLALLSGIYHLPPWEILLRPWADVETLLDALPRIAALNRAIGSVSQDDKRKAALREFQQAVLFLKKGGSSVSGDTP